MAKLNKLFLLELYKLMFQKKAILDICVKHLKYQYLPDEIYKEIWKRVRTHYLAKNTVPSIGTIAQMDDGVSADSKKRLELLGQIREIKTPEFTEIIAQLEEFLKDSLSVDFYESFADIYNKGDKDKARNYLRQIATELSQFSLRSEISFEPIFEGYRKRHLRRKIDLELGANLTNRMPLGIDEFDTLTGGIDIGDTFCALARSGVGKTKLLRHIGVSAARRGFRGLHIQLEGTRAKCLMGYDATWTAQKMINIEEGQIDEGLFQVLVQISESVSLAGGDVLVESFEQFIRPTLVDLRNIILDYIKRFDKAPDFVLVDYLELLDPGNGVIYKVSEERFRRGSLAEGIKNLAIEFGTRMITATQANDIAQALWNDADWVMTRNNVSEAKKLPDSFSFFITLNQTLEEYEEGIMRLFMDKIRDRKGNQTIKIYQDYSHDKFYLKKKTLKEVHGINC